MTGVQTCALPIWTDLTTQIVAFIEKARVRIGRDVRSLANLKATAVTGFTNFQAALPADVSKIRAVYFGSFPLTPVSSQQVGDYLPIPNPTVYCIQSALLTVPGIGTIDIVSVEYWAIPAVLLAGTDISAGMNEWPHIWTQAALAEACIWQRDWDTFDRTVALYTAEVEQINRACIDTLEGVAPHTTSDQPMIQWISSL